MIKVFFSVLRNEKSEVPEVTEVRRRGYRGPECKETFNSRGSEVKRHGEAGRCKRPGRIIV
jgi:hypothetical protein